MVENAAKKLDRVFNALADQTRRELLQTISRKPRTVTELAQPYAMSLNAISKHLKVLERAELIERRRDGTGHEPGNGNADRSAHNQKERTDDRDSRPRVGRGQRRAGRLRLDPIDLR